MRPRALWSVAAALALGLLWSACDSEPPVVDEGPAATGPMVEIVERGEAMASRLEGVSLRAWQLARIARRTGVEVNPLFKEAYEAVDSIGEGEAEEALRYAAALRLKAEGWPGEMAEMAGAAAERIERASSPAWARRAVAAELVGLNRGKALRMLMEAASEAREISDAGYRDAALQAIASEMARTNEPRAVQTASLIGDPLSRAWALRVIGAERSSLRILRNALLEAGKAAPPVGAGPAEAADLLYRKAVAMARIAVDMHASGANAESVLDAVYEAVAVADSIGAPEDRARAYSSVASLMAPVSVPTAAFVASMIDERHAGPLSAARMDIARGMAMRSALAAAAELNAAMAVASRVEDPVERRRALGRAVSLLAEADPDAAARALLEGAAAEIVGGRLPEEMEAVGAALAAVAARDGRVPEEMIERAGAGPLEMSMVYAGLGEAAAADDLERGGQYFDRALQAAREAENLHMAWRVLGAWAYAEPSRALPLMAEAEKPPRPYASRTAMDLALFLKDNGEPGLAGGACRIALEAASQVEPALGRSEALTDVAVGCRGIDRDAARSAFEGAVASARELGSK
ncbi:MAG: hypothetical protein Kow0025_01430 [Thermodesulfovibrionales bacterium]